jgi:hypothetical protein
VPYKDPKQQAFAVLKCHRRNKLRAIAYKGGSCQSCGYSKSVAAMVFHHRDPSQKDFQISGRTISWQRMQTELDKCDLLCANCHFELHEREAEVRYREREALYQT